MENLPSKEKMKEAFEKKDTSGSGKLSFSQMKEVVLEFATEEQKADFSFNFMQDMVLNMADKNGDKMITWAEILLLAFGETAEPEDKMKTAFRAYDTNGDGYLNKKELAEVMKLSGVEADPKMLRMTMALADQDDDGKLNYEEFCALQDGK
eukprot:TRINITY_DN2506_c0_g1_i2.p1 TRINITY_DN2506_c0_g1~~TRINITY_DN2506_c0_g1_i2.p1  ORF type:complete len:151 (-),score=48.99 TRINITY_DN2506_c0_g1_i2:44-496(-)